MAMDDGRVVSNFIVQALLGKPLTVYGNGDQIRSLCYVDDLIDGLYKLFFAEKIYEPINIGNPQPITMLELAKEIIQITNSQSVIEFLELPSDDPLTREPVIEKAQKMISWSPKVEREVGLGKTIEFFTKELRLN
jgi:UDP-glucuronate decarboxylase